MIVIPTKPEFESGEYMAGKGAKQILGAAASILIPIAAPAIAGAMGISSAISGFLGVGARVGSALGSAAVGAVGNAATAALTGGNVGRAAVTGAIGGGLGGGFGGRNSAQGGFGQPAGVPAQTQGGIQMPSFMPTTQGGGIPSIPGQTNEFPTVGGGSNIMDALRKIGSRLTEPEVLLRAAGAIGASVFAGGPLSGLSSAERRLVEQRAAELQQMRAQNQELFDMQLAQAKKSLNEAEYFDPEYFGQSAAADAKQQIQQSGRSAQRQAVASSGGRATGRGSVIERQTALAGGRAASAAFRDGANRAQDARLAAIATARTWLPQPFDANSLSAYGSTMDIYDDLNDRQRERRQAIGRGFGSILGSSTSINTTDQEDDYRMSAV